MLTFHFGKGKLQHDCDKKKSRVSRRENRLGLKAAMKSRDLSRKTGTKKGEAGCQRSVKVPSISG